MIPKKIEGFWIRGNPEEDVLVQNPFVKYTNTYTALVKKFDKKRASKYLWALFMVNDPSCEVIFEQDRNKRYQMVAAHYLKDPEFDWELLKSEIKMYMKEFLTRSKRNLSAIANTMDKLNLRMEDFDESSNAEVKLIGNVVKNLKEISATYKMHTESYIEEKKEVEEILLTKGSITMGPEERGHFVGDA